MNWDGQLMNEKARPNDVLLNRQKMTLKYNIDDWKKGMKCSKWKKAKKEKKSILKKTIIETG